MTKIGLMAKAGRIVTIKWAAEMTSFGNSRGVEQRVASACGLSISLRIRMGGHVEYKYYFARWWLEHLSVLLCWLLGSFREMIQVWKVHMFQLGRWTTNFSCWMVSTPRCFIILSNFRLYLFMGGVGWPFCSRCNVNVTHKVGVIYSSPTSKKNLTNTK